MHLLFLSFIPSHHWHRLTRHITLQIIFYVIIGKAGLTDNKNRCSSPRLNEFQCWDQDLVSLRLYSLTYKSKMKKQLPIRVNEVIPLKHIHCVWDKVSIPKCLLLLLIFLTFQLKDPYLYFKSQIPHCQIPFVMAFFLPPDSSS